MQRDKSLQNASQIKELHNVGDKVWACWLPMGDNQSWFPAIVKSSTVVGKSKYGVIRSYHVVFEDGDEDDELNEMYVMSEEEHRHTVLGTSAFEGVKSKCFKNKTDEYAAIRGAYVTDLTGNILFSTMGAAARARDDELVERNGDKVRRRDLNFPEEWDLVPVNSDRPRRRTPSHHIDIINKKSAECGKKIKQTADGASYPHKRRKCHISDGEGTVASEDNKQFKQLSAGEN
mmetsp:Transcript_2224/g.5909  ORF Transcript_2224/g.5909 Transcript_2224/m.5909 type:complete len:232 (-) Transcript_2224:397-1092(-)